MPEEDKRVTVGLAIVGGLTGLAGVLVIYGLLARAAVPKAKFYMPAEMEVKVTDGSILGMYWKCEFSCPITNTGDTPETHTISYQDNLGRGGSEEITLAPGETYTWSLWYYIDFRRIAAPYVWELIGDWEQDNYSRGEARP